MNKFMLILAASLLLAVPLMAQPMGRGMMGMTDELKLSDQQVEQMKQLKIQHQKKMVSLQADLKTARLELKEIMMQAKIDEKAALTQQDKINAAKGKIAKARLEHRLQARKVLTEEQLKQWQSMGPGMKQGRGHGQRFDCPGCPMGKGHGDMMGPKHGGMMGPGMMGRNAPDDDEDDD